MPYPVNNGTTTDAYSDPLTMVLTPPRKTMSVVVTGAAVNYQFACTLGLRDNEQYTPETFIPPGRYFFDEGDLLPGSDAFCRIRFRSAVTGTPAQVSAS